MTMLIGQMLGCLLVAVGIGGAVGWLLRQLTTGEIIQESKDLTATLHHKERMLEKAQYELNVQAAQMQLLESKIVESEELNQSIRQELSGRNDRLQALQEELAIHAQRQTVLEAEEASVRRRANEYDAAAAAQAEEVKQLQLIRQAAQQTLESNEQERHNLQRRLSELETAVAEADQLRMRVEELEPAQGRVHWLEVQLADQDAEYRAALHQVNSQLAERDRRIGELESLSHRLQEQEEALAQWETKYSNTLTQHEAQRAAQDQLRTQLLLDKQLLNERDERIDGLKRRIQELEAQQQGLTVQVKTVGEKQEEIDRLRKRLVEVRAALRIKADGGAVASRQKTRQNGSQLSLQMEQAKAAKDRSKDDLSKIHGIGPVFARTLNKMGLYTFGQIARWTSEDINKVAKKLYTAPDRIKRDKWVAEAKRQHREKYGENP